MQVNNLVDWSSLSPMEQINHLSMANNAWSAEQAQKQMDFQREMSDTAHQREVADLKAAGLNPVLSAKLGGASTPSGAMGTVDTSNIGALVELTSQALQVANSAVGAYSGSNSGDTLFGLPTIKNPTKPWQLAYNYFVTHPEEVGQAAQAVGVGARSVVEYAKKRAQEESDEANRKVNEDIKETYSGKIVSGNSALAKAAAAVAAGGGIGIFGSGLGNMRYGQNPQLQF